MGFAVELYFDPNLDSTVRSMRVALNAAGVNPLLDQVGDRPHISLAVFHDLDVATLEPHLLNFAKVTTPFAVSFAAISVFPTDEGVLFLAPVVTDTLRDAHRELHRRLSAVATRPVQYYLPNHWVPHCTLAMGIPRAALPTATEVALAHWTPLAGTITEVGLVEFRPVKTQLLYPLAGL